jgi:hypothetical protein
VSNVIVRSFFVNLLFTVVFSKLFWFLLKPIRGLNESNECDVRLGAFIEVIAKRLSCQVVNAIKVMFSVESSLLEFFILSS